MAAKLDMSKAFDRDEWLFLKRVTEKLGFCSKWVNLIMHCISSVSYSVLINGATYGSIKPSRGLQQGDPLSPSLFLLYTEGLSAIIHEAVRNHSLTGISICRSSPSVTHLFFADDSILFCMANFDECQELKLILQMYENASGQMNDSRHTKYLGLPSFIGRSKKAGFLYSQGASGSKAYRLEG